MNSHLNRSPRRNLLHNPTMLNNVRLAYNPMVYLGNTALGADTTIFIADRWKVYVPGASYPGTIYPSFFGASWITNQPSGAINLETKPGIPCLKYVPQGYYNDSRYNNLGYLGAHNWVDSPMLIYQKVVYLAENFETNLEPLNGGFEAPAYRGGMFTLSALVSTNVAGVSLYAVPGGAGLTIVDDSHAYHPGDGKVRRLRLTFRVDPGEYNGPADVDYVVGFKYQPKSNVSLFRADEYNFGIPGEENFGLPFFKFGMACLEQGFNNNPDYIYVDSVEDAKNCSNFYQVFKGKFGAAAYFPEWQGAAFARFQFPCDMYYNPSSLTVTVGSSDGTPAGVFARNGSGGFTNLRLHSGVVMGYDIEVSKPAYSRVNQLTLKMNLDVAQTVSCTLPVSLTGSTFTDDAVVIFDTGL